jgi:hypothetical protein
MSSDFEIGRVVAVDTAQVTIDLSKDLKALTRTTYEGVQEIGRINSYVILPVGAQRLVAMVTRVMLTEEAEIRADRTMVALPSARRVMKATLIGTINGRAFTQGVSLFPVLDNPVHLATAADLNLIFDCKPQEAANPKPEDPGFCIHLGESAVFEGYPIQIDPDNFFGKHAAVLGSTGSGKSCTIASLIQSILERKEIHQTNFVILDTNGEYRSAFQVTAVDGTTTDIAERKILYIPSDSSETASRLIIPYWFLNAEDFVRLFRASQGVQRPVLLEALRLARNETLDRSPAQILREELVLEFNRIWSLSGKDEKTSKDVRDLAKGLLMRVRENQFADAWASLEQLGVKKEDAEKAIEAVTTVAEKHIDNNTYPKVLPADARGKIRDVIDPIYSKLTGVGLGVSGSLSGLSADTPAFFDKLRFRTRHIEQVLRREESGGARARDFSGTMLLRIDRLLADRRFEFLLGPVAQQLPNPEHALATFLRDVMGLESRPTPSPALSTKESVPEHALPFYDRQRAGSHGHHVVILDLSLLAAEVLENVTALIGRLTLECLQRLGESGGESARGSLPVVLVLEEAQNYIREPRHGEEESISRAIFERIAREGRKHGLGLVVASQRPSELSKTVLSQCSSFVVHRLQNPEDLRYFKEIVPGIYGDLLSQLPALAPQTALVLGECVRAPALVRIRDARPLPRSRDPRFYKYWVAAGPTSVPLEETCARWEGKTPEAVPPSA